MRGYKPVAYIAPEGSQIFGAVLESFIDHLPQGVLDRHRFSRNAFDRNQWYSFQLVLDIARDVAAKGGLSVETATGKLLAQDRTRVFNMPDLTYFIEQGLNDTDRAAIRNIPDEFGYITKKLAYNHYHVRSRVPMPDYMVYGYVWEVARHLCQKGEHFSLIVDEGFGQGKKPRLLYHQMGAQSICRWFISYRKR